MTSKVINQEKLNGIREKLNKKETKLEKTT